MFATSSAFRPLALSLAAFGSLCAGAAPVLAQDATVTESASDMGMTVTRVPVKLSDLNLMTVEGRAAADRRCAQPPAGLRHRRRQNHAEQAQDQRNCFSTALRQGKVQVALARQQVLAAR
jgi:UrcA family protein